MRPNYSGVLAGLCIGISAFSGANASSNLVFDLADDVQVSLNVGGQDMGTSSSEYNGIYSFGRAFSYDPMIGDISGRLVFSGEPPVGKIVTINLGAQINQSVFDNDYTWVQSAPQGLIVATANSWGGSASGYMDIPLDGSWQILEFTLKTVYYVAGSYDICVGWEENACYLQRRQDPGYLLAIFGYRVSAVPEVASVWLAVGGLWIIAFFHKRRRANTVYSF